jgi:hypothetical protein
MLRGKEDKIYDIPAKKPTAAFLVIQKTNAAIIIPWRLSTI